MRLLHNHPGLERKLGVDSDHVIVDRDEWNQALKIIDRAKLFIYRQAVLEMLDGLIKKFVWFQKKDLVELRKKIKDLTSAGDDKQ